MTATDALNRVLGGSQVIGGKDKDLLSVVRTGLPYKAYASLVEMLGIELKLQTRLFAVSAKTLQRAKERSKQKVLLDPNLSDRVMRVAQVFADAVDVFEGDEGRALEWMRTPNKALGNIRPLDQLDTHVGTQEVLDVLNRIRYGVFS